MAKVFCAVTRSTEIIARFCRDHRVRQILEEMECRLPIASASDHKPPMKTIETQQEGHSFPNDTKPTVCLTGVPDGSHVSLAGPHLPEHTIVQSGKRQASADKVKQFASRLVDEAGGISFLSATTVLTTFAKIGQPLHFRCSNALGDVLGKEGLKLPFINIRGKRRYALHMATNPDHEKAEFQAWLDGLDAASRRNLQVA